MYGVCQCSLHFPSYTILLLLRYERVLSKYENFNLFQGLHSIAQPSFVLVSLYISELYGHTYFHCSLLWCEKGIVGIKPYLFAKFHTSKHLGI